MPVTAWLVGKYSRTGNARPIITTPEWTLIMPTDGRDPGLCNLAIDPGQTFDVFRRHRQIADGIHAKFFQLFEYLETDPAKVDT